MEAIPVRKVELCHAGLSLSDPTVSDGAEGIIRSNELLALRAPKKNFHAGSNIANSSTTFLFDQQN
jgi:hypothetical protein